MKHFFLSILVFIGTISLKAQLPESSFKGKFNVYPVDSLGVVLLDRNLRQLSNGELAFEFSGLDVSLERKWKNLFPFTNGFSPVFQDISAKGIILIFTDKSRKNFEVLKASTDYGDYERFKYQFSEPVQIGEVTYYYDHLWVAGSIGDYPSILKLKTDNTFEIVPTGLPGKLNYAGELSFDVEKKTLNFLLLAEVNKSDALIWRSLSLSGSMLKNEMLKGFSKSNVRSLKATYKSEKAFVAGTYGFNGRNKAEGLFFAKIGGSANELKLNSYKSVNALNRFKKIDDVIAKGFETAGQSKFRTNNKSVFIDNLVANKNGDFSVVVEVFKPEYRSRGALEKEFIERDRTAQLDQNVYGRRDAFFGDSGTLDLEGRMDRYSATDQLQYRFMGQSLGKAVNQGVSYNHTAIINLDSSMNILDSYGLSFGFTDFGNLAKSSHLKGNGLRYPFNNQFKSFSLETRRAKEFTVNEGSFLLNWTEDLLLEVAYDNANNQLRLSGKRLN